MRLLIFDLDGTLIDSRRDLANAVNATRRHMGLATLPDEVVATYVGNGAPVLMRRAMGPDAPQTDVDAALAFFMDYYGKHDLEHTELYPGVRQSLDRFREAGLRMAVLSNKPLVMTNDILAGLGVAGHFFRVYGGNSFAEKKPHPIGVETLLREAAVDRHDALMVGDSSVDLETARNAGIACCGVTYGFRPESFVESAPDLLIDRMEQLADWLLE